MPLEVVQYEGPLMRVGDSELPEQFGLRYRPTAGEPSWRLDFAVRAGVVECRRFTIEATEDGREIRSSDLRALRVEDLLESACVNVAVRREVDEDGHERLARDLQDRHFGTTSAVRSARRGARRKVTDDALREVAAVYRDNVDSQPTEAVRAHLGVELRTARLWVKRARDAGFLGESIKGKAGER